MSKPLPPIQKFSNILGYIKTAPNMGLKRG